MPTMLCYATLLCCLLLSSSVNADNPVPLPEMVTIPAGEFVMGCSDIEEPPGSTKIICDVSIRYASQHFSFSEFQMGKYEVTQRQYQACVDAGAC